MNATSENDAIVSSVPQEIVFAEVLIRMEQILNSLDYPKKLAVFDFILDNKPLPESFSEADQRSIKLLKRFVQRLPEGEIAERFRPEQSSLREVVRSLGTGLNWLLGGKRRSSRKQKRSRRRRTTRRY